MNNDIMRLKIMISIIYLLLVSVQSSPVAVHRAEGAVVPVHSFDDPSYDTRYGNLSRRREQQTATGHGFVGISAQEWQSFVNKGCNLVGAMASTDKEAAERLKLTDTAESVFKNYAELESWGYLHDAPALEDYQKYGPPINDALRHYGLNDKKSHEKDGEKMGLNECYAIQHTKETKHGEVVYRPTRADFRTVINAVEGVIVGWYKFSASYTGPKQDPPVTVIPQLHRWSDIAFLTWKTAAERHQQDVTNLRFIFSAQIQNSVTEDIVARALSEDPAKEYPDGKNPIFEPMDECDKMLWKDRKQFSMEQQQGKALLASPNGVGAAYLLIQHKSTFGEKTTIEGVTVWCDAHMWNWNIMFHVRKAPVQKPKEEQDPNKPKEEQDPNKMEEDPNLP